MRYLQRNGDMKAVDYAVACYLKHYQPTRELYLEDGTPRSDPFLIPQIEPAVAPGPVPVQSPRQAWLEPATALWRGPLPHPEPNPFPDYKPPSTALQHLAVRLAALATTSTPFHEPEHAIHLFHESRRS